MNSRDKIIEHFNDLNGGGLNVSSFCSLYDMERQFVIDTMFDLKHKNNQNTCSICEETKHIDEFPRVKNYIRKQCKKCHNEKQRFQHKSRKRKPIKRESKYIRREAVKDIIEKFEHKPKEKIYNNNIEDDLSTREVQAKQVNELPNGKTQVIFESKMNYD